MAGLTADEVSKLGAMLRNAREGNLLVGRFAAEMVGEFVPLFNEDGRRCISGAQ